MTEVIVGAGLPAAAVGEDLDFAEVFGGQIGRVATRAERASGAARRVAEAGGDPRRRRGPVRGRDGRRPGRLRP